MRLVFILHEFEYAEELSLKLIGLSWVVYKFREDLAEEVYIDDHFTEDKSIQYKQHTVQLVYKLFAQGHTKHIVLLEVKPIPTLNLIYKTITLYTEHIIEVSSLPLKFPIVLSINHILRPVLEHPYKVVYITIAYLLQ